MKKPTILTSFTLGAVLLGLRPVGAQAADLEACGYHNLSLVMEQLPTSFTPWYSHINDSMWLYNQYMDIYRYTDSDGSVGNNSQNEFDGWFDDATLFSLYGYHWGSGLAMTITYWPCVCCQISQSDVIFNNAYSWTDDAGFAEDNPSILYFDPILLHEMGHTWGMQTENEDYNYSEPTVMHAYTGASVQDYMTLHVPETDLIRQHYMGQTAIIPRVNFMVVAKYANGDWINATTDKTTYQQGEALTIDNLTVENTGTVDVNNPHIRLYFSSNRLVSTGDSQIGDYFWGSFPAQSYGVYSFGVSVPTDITPGAYYAGAIVTINGYGGDDLWYDDSTHLYQQVYIYAAPPTGVSATDGTYSDKVRITWNSVPGAPYYQVYRATSLGGFRAAISSWQFGTSFDDTTATPGFTYYYWVSVATDSSGSWASDYSAYDTGWRAPLVTVTATDAAAGEPGTGQGTGTFTFSRTGSTASALTVNFAVGGTAISGADYTPIGTTVAFSVGSGTATKTVNVLDDATVEGNETAIVTLMAGTGYSIGSPSSATVTIQDDDATVTVTATDVMAGEPGSGQGTGIFAFTRTGFTLPVLTVNFTVGGTATSGSDYTSIGTTIAFGAGSATATKTVSVIDDTLVEGNETVVVTLASGSGYTVGSPASATVTIQDDDVAPLPVVTVTASDTTAGEPGTGQGTGTFTFSRTGSAALALTVNFTVGGTATSGADYTSIGTTVAFAAGSATATKTVSVIDDTLVEGIETVVVTLASGSGYTVGSLASATVTIQDYVAVPIVTVSASDTTAGEPGTGQGTGTFIFSRTGSAASALTVNFTVGGTATSGADYTSIGTTVAFAAGSATATKTVSVIDDTLLEGNETVVVTLASGSGYTVGSPASATVTIQDYVAAPIVTVSASDTRAGEPGTGQGTGTFTFSRTGSAASALTVNFTVGGTATGGADYTSIGTTVAFAAGSATVTKTVSVIDDTLVEGDETAVVTLASGASYTIGSPSSATVTIQDDDGSPSAAYVTSKVLSTLRNNYTGFVGMRIGVGPSPITVTALGRIFVSGNSGTHTVKLVNATGGGDVAGGSVSLAMSGGTAGQFKYANLSGPVVLAANTTYYVVSQETIGGDSWYNFDTTVTTTSVATELSAVYGTGGVWNSAGSAGQTYGPVDFKYANGPSVRTLTVASSNPNSGVSITVSPNDNNGAASGTTLFTRVYDGGSLVNLTAPLSAGGNNFQKWQKDGVDSSITANTSVTMDANHTITAVYVTPAVDMTYVTSKVLSTLRNNYTGFVGMRIGVGPSPITVTALGRIFVSGNSGTHTVKLVNATGGGDVAGGSVSLAMSGGTAGQFKYANLSGPVVLAANTTYYVVSQETIGGDSWYNFDTTVTTTSVATELSAVYGTGGVWNSAGSAGQTYGPVDFKYH